MNSLAMNPPREICTLGAAALRILSNTKQGTVLASMTHTTYLLSSEGELCWSIPMDGLMHQRGMQSVSSLPLMKAGSRFEVADHTLTTYQGEQIGFQHASIWRSPAPASTAIVSRPRLSESITFFVKMLLKRHNPSGLGSLITPIIQEASNQNTLFEGCLTHGIAGKTWSVVQRMIKASRITDTQVVIEQAKYLIGLGEGLTPSGDDFLGGFFFAKQLLAHYYPDVFWDDPLCTYSDFIAQSKPLTNLISYTLLKDHINGQSVESLHRLANGLLQGENTDHLVLHAERLISVGHSTGWDLLTGFLAGISAAFNQS